jgi:hypothetical protein
MRSAILALSLAAGAVGLLGTPAPASAQVLTYWDGYNDGLNDGLVDSHYGTQDYYLFGYRGDWSDDEYSEGYDAGYLDGLNGGGYDPYDPGLDPGYDAGFDWPVGDVGDVGDIPAGADAGTVGELTLYRLYLPAWQIHLFTTDPNEYAYLPQLGWIPEGRAFGLLDGPAVSQEGNYSVPLYRLYNASAGEHLYTSDENEYLVLREYPEVFSDDGVMGHVFVEPTYGTVPLYRILAPDGLSHLFTTDEVERQYPEEFGWLTEGVVGYVIP